MRVVALARAVPSLPSIADQLRRCRRWAMAKGHDIVRLRRPRYVDWCTPAIGDVLAACRRREVDALAVVDLSLLAPLPGVLAAVTMLLGPTGTRIAVVDEDGPARIHEIGSPEFSHSADLARAWQHAWWTECAERPWLNHAARRKPSVLRLIGRCAPGNTHD